MTPEPQAPRPPLRPHQESHNRSVKSERQKQKEVVKCIALHHLLRSGRDSNP